MSGEAALQVRRLPDGPLEVATAEGWDGHYLTIQLAADTGEIRRGSLVQIEAGAMFYLGEVQQLTALSAVVRVEHSVDRSKLAAVQHAWG